MGEETLGRGVWNERMPCNYTLETAARTLTAEMEGAHESEQQYQGWDEVLLFGSFPLQHTSIA